MDEPHACAREESDDASPSHANIAFARRKGAGGVNAAKVQRVVFDKPMRDSISRTLADVDATN
eukprot:6397263-Heterocapsa_arctica.AAC.1